MYDSLRSLSPVIKHGSVQEFTIPSFPSGSKGSRRRSQSVVNRLPQAGALHGPIRKFSATEHISTSSLPFSTFDSPGSKSHKLTSTSLTNMPRRIAPRLSQIKECHSLQSTSKVSESFESSLGSAGEKSQTSIFFSTVGEIKPCLYQEKKGADLLESSSRSCPESVSSVHRLRFQMDYSIRQKQLNISLLNINRMHEGAAHINVAKIKTKVKLFNSCDKKPLKVVWATSKDPTNLSSVVQFKGLSVEQLVTSSVRFSSYMTGKGLTKRKHLGESVEEICQQNLCGIVNHSILRNKPELHFFNFSVFSSAPYVTLTLVNEDGLKIGEGTTNRVWFTKNPVFKQSFLFKLPQKNLTGLGLRLTVKNGNILSPRKTMGELMFSWPREKWQQSSTSLQWKKMLKNPGIAVDAWHDISYIL
ncbi:hypothetical protein HOLleu_33653 [Holothuria leucospilota]|uniref:C2 domain-containing protein n=1 Tax=Holothuria leucospilota TaxID=206669 RepID=A0A9Q0YP16_HOLLE|nr:hypothetical protein HOLleu_33653 [Holothuria leucospilota]